MDALVKSLTPLFFLFFCKISEIEVPYVYRIHYLNLCISSLLYHYSIEYDISKEYKYIFELYDRVAISLFTYTRIFKNKNYKLILVLGLLSIFIQYNKHISYILAYITICTEVTISYNIYIFITLCISFYVFFTRCDEKWTIIGKLIWHFTQSFYIHLSGSCWL